MRVQLSRIIWSDQDLKGRRNGSNGGASKPVGERGGRAGWHFKAFSGIMLRRITLVVRGVVMWGDQKRRRFEELRAPGRHLNAAEQAELEALVKELEDAEAVYLQPATERRRQENDRLAKRNLHLAELVKRKEALVQRLENVLTEAQAEQRAIETELAFAGNQESNVAD